MISNSEFFFYTLYLFKPHILWVIRLFNKKETSINSKWSTASRKSLGCTLISLLKTKELHGWHSEGTKAKYVCMQATYWHSDSFKCPLPCKALLSAPPSTACSTLIKILSVWSCLWGLNGKGSFYHVLDCRSLKNACTWIFLRAFGVEICAILKAIFIVFVLYFWEIYNCLS